MSTDKELAREWAERVQKERRTRWPNDRAAARFILATIGDEKPAAEDAELANVAQCLRETSHGMGAGCHEISAISLRDYLDTMEQLVIVLAKRAMGIK